MRQQGVPSKDRRRIIEGFVDRRLPAAQIIIVHRRKIVVNQRVAVNKLHSDASWNRCLWPYAENCRGLSDKKWPEPLSAVQCSMPHCRDEPRRSRTGAGQLRVGEVSGQGRVDAPGIGLYIDIEGVGHGRPVGRDELAGRAMLYTGSWAGRKPVRAIAGAKRRFCDLRPFSMGHLCSIDPANSRQTPSVRRRNPVFGGT